MSSSSWSSEASRPAAWSRASCASAALAGCAVTKNRAPIGRRRPSGAIQPGSIGATSVAPLPSRLGAGVPNPWRPRDGRDSSGGRGSPNAGLESTRWWSREPFSDGVVLYGSMPVIVSLLKASPRWQGEFRLASRRLITIDHSLPHHRLGQRRLVARTGHLVAMPEHTGDPFATLPP